MFMVEPIGRVENAVIDGIDTDWGGVQSEICIEEEYADGLYGLEEFSHALIVYYMHASSFSPSDLIRRPQGREELPLTGIFAQRAKHRPNPIGITAVKILGIKGNTITVEGLDAINGTPVLDIKPYFPTFDCRTDTRQPAWVNRIMEHYF